MKEMHMRQKKCEVKKAMEVGKRRWETTHQDKERERDK